MYPTRQQAQHGYAHFGVHLAGIHPDDGRIKIKFARQLKAQAPLCNVAQIFGGVKFDLHYI